MSVYNLRLISCNTNLTVSRSVDDLAKLAPTVDTGCVNVRRRKLRLFVTRSIPRCLDARLDTERVAGAGRAMLEHRLARRVVIRLLFVRSSRCGSTSHGSTEVLCCHLAHSGGCHVCRLSPQISSPLGHC